MLQEGGCSWLLQNNIKSVGQEHLQHNRFLKFVLTKPCAAIRRQNEQKVKLNNEKVKLNNEKLT